MIYVYAITDPVRIDDGASGLEDAPLEAIEGGGVSAVYSTHTKLEAKPDPELLWRHEKVVERLMDRAGVLPLRFGTVLRDTDALRAVLTDEGSRYRLLLSRVRGCVELAVRVGLPPSPEKVSSRGTDYMRERLAARRHQADAADRVLAPLRPLARATSRRSLGAGSTTISESYLVPRVAVESFVAHVRELQSQNGSLSISCTGPWGPYSFVGEANR
jgi:hypothetical protein